MASKYSDKFIETDRNQMGTPVLQIDAPIL